MPKHLGELGGEPVDPAPIDATFGFYGQTIRVHPDFNELEMLDFIEANEAVATGSAEDMKAAKQFLAMIVHPDDADLLWQTAKRNRCKAAQLFGELPQRIIAELADRPITPPSDSSSGPTETGPTSTGGSSSQVERVLGRLDGRPDLQLAVVQAQEARSAA